MQQSLPRVAVRYRSVMGVAVRYRFVMGVAVRYRFVMCVAVRYPKICDECGCTIPHRFMMSVNSVK